MKIHVLSDLHLGFEPFEAPATDADVVVLAGDIARPAPAVAWACALGKPAVYVAGNHEFYGGSLDGTLAELRTACAGTPVTLLECDEVVLGGVRFLGTTLWTDFAALGSGAARAECETMALALVRDFTRIRAHSGGERAFAPADSVALFERNAAWLEARLAVPFAGPTVVVTHHAPSLRSIHARYAGSPINACFVSDAERLLGGDRATLWIHGHTHDSFDYTVDGTRVLCNPRGYAKGGRVENERFDAGLVVEV